MCDKIRRLCNKDDCEICFNRSFASHEFSKYWDYDKNDNKPRNVFKNTGLKYNFTCNKCNHNFNTALCSMNHYNRFCPYCVNQKLCDSNECEICYDKSFKSHPFSIYWSKNNILLPENIFKGTPKKYLFVCNCCNHEFLSRIADIKVNTNNCPYCSSKIFCENDECKYCLNKSFASNEKSKCWSDKNNIKPRYVFKNSNKKYIFNCDDCKNEFTMTTHGITFDNRWCPTCKHKTEKILFKWLCDKFDKNNIKFQYIIKKQDKIYKYDYYIKNFNILIELDGNQHFNQIKNWATPEYNLENDINKINIANDNNLSIIHLLQNDVYKNKNNWENKLLNSIKLYNKPTIIIIDNNNIYKNHLENMDKENTIVIN